MPRARWATGVVAALVLASAGIGACLFTPRDPPPPCTGCNVPFNTPLTPQIMLDNIKTALQKPFVENYRKSLSADFLYVPDPESEAAHPAHFLDWNLDREVRFMQTVLEGSLRPASIEFKIIQFEDSGEVTDPDRKRYNVQYEMTLVFPDATRNPPTRTDRFCGRAQWDLIGGNTSNWTLQKWTDIGPLDPGVCGTLGLLRGAN